MQSIPGYDNWKLDTPPEFDYAEVEGVIHYTNEEDEHIEINCIGIYDIDGYLIQIIDEEGNDITNMKDCFETI